MKIKGNILVGQSGGPTAAINATLAGVLREAFASEKIDTVYGIRNGIEGFLDGSLFSLGEHFHGEEDFSLLEQTPACALGSCRLRLPEAEADEGLYRKIFERLKQNQIRAFFYIGGNDSMDTVKKLSAYAEKHAPELSVIGIPKTIDNDLCQTDHTPGFGSAAKYIATTVHEILRDCAVYTLPAVTIIEIMGRDTGWLTCAAALPSIVCGEGPDLIYLPEHPFSKDRFLQDVRHSLKQHPDVVIAVSEGLKDEAGRLLSEDNAAEDEFGHRMLTGAGKHLAQFIRQEIGCKVRSVELNVLQRCAAHLVSAVDIKESSEVGKAAVRAAFAGETGKMMAIHRLGNQPYQTEMISVPIAKAANLVKYVPQSFLNEEGNGVSELCLEYLYPLIQGEVPQKYRNGLPAHFVF